MTAGPDEPGNASADVRPKAGLDAWLGMWHWALLALAWLAVLALLQQLPRLPHAGEFAALLVATVLPGLPWRAPPRRAGARCALLALGLAAAAFTQGAWRAQQRLEAVLDPAWEGRELMLSGRIASLPQAIQG